MSFWPLAALQVCMAVKRGSTVLQCNLLSQQKDLWNKKAPLQKGIREPLLPQNKMLHTMFYRLTIAGSSLSVSNALYANTSEC